MATGPGLVSINGTFTLSGVLWACNGVPTSTLLPNASNGDYATNVATGEVYQLSSGTWTDTGLTFKGTQGPPGPGGGVVVGHAETDSGAYAAGSGANIPFNNSIPQNTQGDPYLSVAYTPQSTANKLRFVALMHFSCSGSNSTVTAAIFNQTSGAANALGSAAQFFPTATGIGQVKVEFEIPVPSQGSPITFTLRAGAQAGTIYMNGTNGAQNLGGSLISSLSVTELTQ